QLFTDRTIWTVVGVLALFGWPQMARIARGAVISAKNNDYVMASEALGVSKLKTLIRHVIPNSLAPIIVVATISLGTYIVAEATLSFLGIGLPSTEVSWGGDISNAQVTLRQGSTILFYPATALAITVLGFIMMGDALRDALDPKSRKR
ncbi:ABC transporter permease, partial [Streptomyces collinus]